MRTGWADAALAAENALAAKAAGCGSSCYARSYTRADVYWSRDLGETLHNVAQALTKSSFYCQWRYSYCQDAQQRIEEVGADAVMIGRAAMGNPYLFHQTNHYFDRKSCPISALRDKSKSLTII